MSGSDTQSRPSGQPQDQPSPGRPSSPFRARIRTYFLAGLLITAPISITLYLAWLFVSFIDDQVQAVLPPRFNPETYLPFSVPGVGVILVIAFLIVVGATTAGFIGRMMIGTYERVLARIPAVRTVYSAIKQIMETVLANQSQAFREVVLVEYPRRGMWAIGFITGRTQGEVQTITADELINIFIPTTPNPTSGFLLFAPERDCIRLSMPVDDAIKMVISAGLVTPPDTRPPEVRNRVRVPSVEPGVAARLIREEEEEEGEKAAAAQDADR